MISTRLLLEEQKVKVIKEILLLMISASVMDHALLPVIVILST